MVDHAVEDARPIGLGRPVRRNVAQERHENIWEGGKNEKRYWTIWFVIVCECKQLDYFFHFCIIFTLNYNFRLHTKENQKQLRFFFSAFSYKATIDLVVFAFSFSPWWASVFLFDLAANEKIDQRICWPARKDKKLPRFQRKCEVSVKISFD